MTTPDRFVAWVHVPGYRPYPYGHYPTLDAAHADTLRAFGSGIAAGRCAITIIDRRGRTAPVILQREEEPAP